MRTRRLGLLVALAAVIVVGSAGAVSAGWGTAIEVPGTASLNTAGYAYTTSISCPAAGACAAGGWYKDGSGYVKPFVVNEKDGAWGDAVEVPGIAALSSGDGVVSSVSCGLAGACVAGGYYSDGLDHYEAFLVSETNGHWGDAIDVPGMATLNHGPDAHVNSVSCPAAGECVAGGVYSGPHHHTQAFVVVETHGRWHHAVRMRGTPTLNRGLDARVNSVACGAVGECVAGGHFTDRSGHYRAFIETMKHGRWGWAVEVPSTPTLNTLDAEVTSVACGGADACAAGGYTGTSGQAFLVSETHGRWSPPVAVSGREIMRDSRPQVASVSCAAVGSCVAVGMFTDDLAQSVFVMSSKHGHWGRAIEIPGIVALNTEGDAEMTSVS